ncbi:1-phosphofructokinase family hexose kinase [Gordonia oryzae]|uniref:1-phosphofructokinase family hexose kinase n=1 Tax=Gordonia oryzae TaxID=2487349 RepID=A0A3N4HG74_9ACTN|nr:1-phosphofructokinase family hexose kinase [Gordonia oryzae]RPA66074.1 1-phosphofructokinase family hexose kinase [Gordonia oryzae]
MILTVTANPSLDRTLEIAGPLLRGEVQRTIGVRAEPGGKGVNVSRVIAEAGLTTLAVLPARAGDPLLTALDQVGLRHETLAVPGEVRSNITIAEPDGTTTKINASGQVLVDHQVRALTDLVLARATGADWVALCGSLPPGVTDDWYRVLADQLIARGHRVAIDTSGAPLSAAVTGRIDLIKPNEYELAEVSGTDPEILRRAAAEGDLSPIVSASADMAHRIGGAVLATLGAAGALLTTESGSWFATPPPIVPRSTVGAGDSSLAGYLIAETRGADEPGRLRNAVAYGAAAAALAGTQPPRPDHLDPDHVVITDLAGAAPTT